MHVLTRSSIAERIFAGVLALTFIFSFSPSTAQAVTIEELQAQINSLLATIASLQEQLKEALAGTPTGTTPPPPAQNCIDLKYNLYLGKRDRDTNGEVSKLQQFLTDQGVYSGLVGGYFGPATERAVQKWQAKNGVVSSGDPDSTGYGVVGPKTREVMGCGAVVYQPQLPPLPIPQTPPVPTANVATIHSFSGPAQLNANERGTWTIRASNPNNEPVTYRVDWGDNLLITGRKYASSLAPNPTFTQTATLTHTYTRPGTYTVRVWVRPQSGGTEQMASATVRVVGDASSVPVAPLQLVWNGKYIDVVKDLTRAQAQRYCDRSPIPGVRCSWNGMQLTKFGIKDGEPVIDLQEPRPNQSIVVGQGKGVHFSFNDSEQTEDAAIYGVYFIRYNDDRASNDNVLNVYRRSIYASKSGSLYKGMLPTTEGIPEGSYYIYVVNEKTGITGGTGAFVWLKGADGGNVNSNFPGISFIVEPSLYQENEFVAWADVGRWVGYTYEIDWGEGDSPGNTVNSRLVTVCNSAWSCSSPGGRTHEYKNPGLYTVKLFAIKESTKYLVAEATVRVGNTQLSDAQKRDEMRHADILAITQALERFKQKFGRYPGSKDGVSLGGEMIGDDNGPIEQALRKAGMNFIPKDPKHDGKNYFYSYDPHHWINLKECKDDGSIPPNSSQAATVAINKFETEFGRDRYAQSVTCVGTNMNQDQAAYVWGLYPTPDPQPLPTGDNDALTFSLDSATPGEAMLLTGNMDNYHPIAVFNINVKGSVQEEIQISRLSFDTSLLSVFSNQVTLEVWDGPKRLVSSIIPLGAEIWEVVLPKPLLIQPNQSARLSVRMNIPRLADGRNLEEVRISLIGVEGTGTATGKQYISGTESVRSPRIVVADAFPVISLIANDPDVNTQLGEGPKHMVARIRIGNPGDKDVAIRKLVYNLNVIADDTDGNGTLGTIWGEVSGTTVAPGVRGISSPTYQTTVEEVVIPARTARYISIFADTTDMEDNGDVVQVWLDDSSSDNVIFTINGRGRYAYGDIILKGDQFGPTIVNASQSQLPTPQPEQPETVDSTKWFCSIFGCVQAPSAPTETSSQNQQQQQQNSTDEPEEYVPGADTAFSPQTASQLASVLDAIKSVLEALKRAAVQ